MGDSDHSDAESASNIRGLSSDSEFWEEYGRDGYESENDGNEGTSVGRNQGNKFLVVCHLCNAKLKTLSGYRNHLKVHRMRELLQCKPCIETFRRECQNVIGGSLQEIAAVDASVPHAVEINRVSRLLSAVPVEQCAFFDEVLTELLKVFYSVSEKCASSFDASFKRGVYVLLGNMDMRKQLLSKLRESIASSCTSDAGHWIVATVTRKFAETVESFFLRSMREDYELRLFEGRLCDEPTRDNPDDLTFQQTIYYIGGSTVRSVMKAALRGASDQKWKRILACIKSRFLVGDLAGAPSSDIMSWTESQNRGGLKFISEPVWSFLMAFSGLLSKLEGNNGSLLHLVVFEAVKNDDVLVALWGEVVGDSLSADESELLLCKTCLYFTNTWGVGVALRRKNAIPTLPKDKNTLRASLL